MADVDAEREIELEPQMERDLEPERELEREDELPWAPAGTPPKDDAPDLSELSSVACPYCGYLPRTARGAARHLVGHLLGTHTTGEEQLGAIRDA